MRRACRSPGVDRLRLNAPLAVQDLLAAIRFVLQPERRPQPRQPARLAADRLDAGRADARRAARERGSLWRHLTRDAGRRAAGAAPRDMLARADLHDAVPVSGGDAVGAARRAAQADPAAGRGGARSDRGAAERRAGVRDDDDAVAAALPRLVRSRRRRHRPRCRRAARRGAGDDRAWGEGAAGAGRHPGGRVRRPDAVARARCCSWRPSARRRAGPGVPRRAQSERGGPLDEVRRRGGGGASWRSIGGCSTSPRPARRSSSSSPDRSARAPRACRRRRAGMPRRRRAFDALGVAAARASGPSPARGRRRRCTATRGGARRCRAARACAGLGVPCPRRRRRDRRGRSRPRRWARMRSPIRRRRRRCARRRSAGACSMRCSSGCPRCAAAERAAGGGSLARARGRRGGCRRAARRSPAPVCAVLDDPRFADLFGPDVAGRGADRGGAGDGTVVRAPSTGCSSAADRVRVVDFKTGRQVPAGADAVPPYHLRQMAAYAAALARDLSGSGDRGGAALHRRAGADRTAARSCSRAQAAASPPGSKACRSAVEPGRRATIDAADKEITHGDQEDHRRQLPGRRAGRPTSRCWSISGRNGADRAR